MESLPEIDVIHCSPSEMLASSLNIPEEQIDHINAKSQKRKYPDSTADKPFMESGACPPFIKPPKQDEDRNSDFIPILLSKQFTFQSHIFSLYMIPTKYKFIIREFKKIIIPQSLQN